MSYDHFNLDLSLPTLSAVAAATWFVWQRYQNLNQRLRSIETEAIETKHLLEQTRQATLSDGEMTLYRINGNTELINHRTMRFQTAHDALEKRLTADIAEIRGFLKTVTDFGVRSRSNNK
ncbi:MAG: hypothetical protein AAF609_08510 [Cyanobacteria bacterium P01_C01_bin.120]